MYKTIYKLISKNRSFQTAEWAQSIEDINKLELEILNSIEFQDVSYKYQYILELDENIFSPPTFGKCFFYAVAVDIDSCPYGLNLQSKFIAPLLHRLLLSIVL